MGDFHFSRQTSLNYHEQSPSGKIGVSVLKPLNDDIDLSKAYTPGVAYVVEEIIKDPESAYLYTNKSHMVAVISNGTAVLGFGNVGALAAMPVMEGKAALIKSLVGLDAVSLVIDCQDPDKLVEMIVAVSHNYGGILLEDIKAPDCFEIERKLQEKLNIPVFHDDQHGTSIVVSAALINALQYQGKEASEVKVVLIGCGAAGYSVFKMFPLLGIKAENVYVFDSYGLVCKERKNIGKYKELFATQEKSVSLHEALVGANVVIGLSKANLLFKEDLEVLAPNPIIFALSNPTPEVDPSLVRQVRSDAVLCTGRSDLSNTVNNVIAFPYLLKSLVLTRTSLTEEIKFVMAQMIAKLNYDKSSESFIPKPLDPRLKNLTEMLVNYINTNKK